MEKKNFFIKTNDEKVAERLTAAGFTFMGKEGELYAFINNNNLITFSEEDVSKISYSDALCI